MNSVPTTFWERMPAQWSSGDLIMLLLIVVAAVLTAIAIIGSIVYAMHKNRLEDSLKRELLDRGMTADEIATVISTKPVRTGMRREHKGQEK